MRILRPTLVLLVVTVGACATVTPYQSLTKGMGYSEQKLESNRYKVSFSGNSSTPKQTVENYLLYRAAEITLANGYDYFVTAQRSTDADTRYTQTFSGGFGNFGYYSWYPRNAFGANVGTSTSSTEYQADADILMYKGSKPEGNLRAFDARELKANLEPSIVRPKTS